ncbi:MAG: endonuclease MutS2, partial [Chloroflexaceae bacterium]|nr:endonuclease MutS2 [Chloroflexaceae bacterium]
GKTVSLKSLGLAALMAKAGLFVPAREPVELPCFEQVLADIGDEQSLQQNLSTFSGHIRRISRIIDAIHPESDALHPLLVLLDEVGAGTDPTEGSAIAAALLRYLAETALLTIATTHYGELKALKYQDDRFENASVEFDDRTLSPTYRLLWGIPGRSNALAIAGRLGLKAEIIELAQQDLGGVTEDVNQVIAALEAERRDQESKAQAARQLLAQTERFYEEVAGKAAQLEAREQELKQTQEREIQQALQQAKTEIAKVIRQLQGSPTAQSARQATETLNAIAERELSKREPRAPKPGYLPQVGERVRIPSLAQTAEVLTAPDGAGEVTVRFGLMKMTVSLGEIESLDGKKADIPVKSKPTAPPPSTPAKALPTIRTDRNTLDLRGSRVADAEIEIDRAIAKVLDLGTLWIIHGKGTGKLREGVQAFLQHHPLVKRFENAPANEGGSGVTVAYLT